MLAVNSTHSVVMSSSSSFSYQQDNDEIESLQDELTRELEIFERIIQGGISDDVDRIYYKTLSVSPKSDANKSSTPSSSQKYRSALNAFELAEIEGESEELHDKMASLLGKSVESEQVITRLEGELKNLNIKFDLLEQENNILRTENSLAAFNNHRNHYQNEDEMKESLEYKLAETKFRLARALTQLDDSKFSMETLEYELEKERKLRIRYEKERKIYEDAYVESIKYVEILSKRQKQAENMKRK